MRADVNPTAAFAVRRSSRARRARLTIGDDGVPVVTLPLRAPEHTAAQLVTQHRQWIERDSGRIQARLEALASRPALERGRSIQLAGVAHRVVVLTALDSSARSEVRPEPPASIVVTRRGGERRTTAELLERWLRQRATKVIAERAAVLAERVGVAYRSIAVRDQRTRWGSASRRGTLSFSWRLVLCPPEVLDYVVVHELAHLRVAGHSRAFWRLVELHHVDSSAARRWLREHHDELRHALD